MNYTILNKIELKNGKNLIIRKPIVDDAASIIKYLNTVGGESDNLLFGKDEFRLTLEQESEYIKNINENANSIMLLGVMENDIVSISLITSFSRKRIAHNCDLSISVKKDYWNVGIGNAMMKELIKFGNESDTIRNISLGVKANNFYAIKLYEKFGFKKVGEHKNFFNINGKYDDEILMDLIIK